MHALQEAPTAALLDGRYQLGECVGEGGMSQVYRAEDVLLGRTVAVKMMRADTEMPGSPVRARTEMTVLASLNHPSLVKLLDGSVEPGRPHYLVMEFVDGQTLAHRLCAGAMPAADVAHLAFELGSALHVVHSAGVVHRDLKPSNVLMAANPVPGQNQQVKLADFGVAYLCDSTRVTTPGMVVGTAAYLAPEQVRGEVASPAADIYALGLVLLEALTGERAYPHASGIGAIMARLLDSPAVPEWVGPAWADLIGRMTATDPTQRPTALEVAQAAACLPGDVRAVPMTGEPAVTQASALRSFEHLPPTRPLPATMAPSNPTPRPTPQRPRRLKAVALLGSAAAAALLCVTTVWAGASATTDQPANLRVVEQPAPTSVADDVESAVDEVQPAAVTSNDDAAEAVETQHGPSDQDAKAEQKLADQALRDAEQAQREAERAARDSEKAQRDAEREGAKPGKKG